MAAKGKIAGGVAAAILAIAVPFIAGWEGKRNHAYLDTIAKPAVWTVCYGHTGKYAYKGAKYSDAKCKDILAEDVGTHYAGITQCMDVANTPVSIQASALELAFNVGVGAFCRSTMQRKIAAKDYNGACTELDKWVKAGGVTVRGLVNRRNASEEMCKRDL